MQILLAFFSSQSARHALPRKGYQIFNPQEKNPSGAIAAGNC
jgi:hypothetical protein